MNKKDLKIYGKYQWAASSDRGRIKNIGAVVNLMAVGTGLRPAGCDINHSMKQPQADGSNVFFAGCDSAGVNVD